MKKIACEIRFGVKYFFFTFNATFVIFIHTKNTEKKVNEMPNTLLVNYV